MADHVILVRHVESVDGAEAQVTQRLQSLRTGHLARVRAQEADAQGLLVEVGRVQALVAEAASLVDGAVVADAEVVADVGPAEDRRVQHLQVAHLLGAGLVRVAIIAGRVVDDHPGGGQVRQRGIGAHRAAPFRLRVDSWTHCEIGEMFGMLFEIPVEEVFVSRLDAASTNTKLMLLLFYSFVSSIRSVTIRVVLHTFNLCVHYTGHNGHQE